MSKRYVFLGGLSIVKVCRQGREGVKNVCMYVFYGRPPFAVLWPLDLDYKSKLCDFLASNPIFFRPM